MWKLSKNIYTLFTDIGVKLRIFRFFTSTLGEHVTSQQTTNQQNDKTAKTNNRKSKGVTWHQLRSSNMRKVGHWSVRGTKIENEKLKIEKWTSTFITHSNWYTPMCYQTLHGRCAGVAPVTRNQQHSLTITYAVHVHSVHT